MTEIFRPPFFQPDSVNGVPLAGALLYFYTAGTTTPITVYQDSGLITPHASPVVADASGIFPAIYVNTSSYKIVLQTSAAVTVKTYDNINTTSSSTTVLDSTFTIQNASDNTKQVQFNAANLTTGTTRTFAFPDTNGTFLTTGSLATNAQAATATSSVVALSPANLAQERGFSDSPYINFSIGTSSVAANALTIPFKGVDGNDHAAANPGYISFRSATAASGALAQLALTSAQSLVVPSGASLGSVNAVATTYALAAFNNAGAIIWGIRNYVAAVPITDGIATTTILNGSSTSADVWYTTSALTSKAYTIVAYFTATEATAGTWLTVPATMQVSTAPAVNNALPIITPWVAYTPTFTGFGTAASINIESRRIGDTLQIRGYFTTGTVTATEARLSIGFNGTDGNVTSSTTKVSAIQVAGVWVTPAAVTFASYTLIESAVSYITFGLQNSGSGGLTKQLGNAAFSNASKYSVMADIPIQGW